MKSAKRQGYLDTVLAMFWNYSRARHKLSYLPFRIWIEPTNSCNLKCSMCPNKEFKPDQIGFMEFPLYTRIIDEASEFVQDINLHHRGESLLHPRFPDMIRYAKDKGLITKFHTNGTLLDEKKSKSIIEAGLDFINFSFEVYQPERYKQVRGRDYQKTLDNILTFLKVKKSLARIKRPFVVLETIDFDDSSDRLTAGDKKRILSIFKGLPLNKIETKKVHNWAGSYKQLPLPDKIRKVYSPCCFLWFALLVFWDGTVTPCPQDFFGILNLGNVKEVSLAEIFQGQKMTELRKKMVDRDVLKLHPCIECDLFGKPTFLGIPVEKLKFIWKHLNLFAIGRGD